MSIRKPSPRFQIALVALILLLCGASARAAIIDITIMNATFSATCVGSSAICTEVINGSFVGNTVTLTFSSVLLNLTGTLTAALDSLGTAPVCNQPGCTSPPYFYDSGANPSLSPIEFNPTILTFSAPTPTAFGAGTSLFVPTGCGGDQPSCNNTGTFPANGNLDYEHTSGTYTAVAIPEPGSVILLAAGLAMLGFRRELRANVISQ